jgi:hypothetical protein
MGKVEAYIAAPAAMKEKEILTGGVEPEALVEETCRIKINPFQLRGPPQDGLVNAFDSISLRST